MAPSPWLRLTQTERNLVSDLIQNHYNYQKCGVCEKEGADVYWNNPISKGAHRKCFEKIWPTETELVRTIDDLFKHDQDYRINTKAHIAAVRAVKEKCGDGPIITYIEKNGEKAITHLFNTVGVQAAKQFASQVRALESLGIPCPAAKL